jgi:hypothetical protein
MEIPRGRALAGDDVGWGLLYVFSCLSQVIICPGPTNWSMWTQGSLGRFDFLYRAELNFDLFKNNHSSRRSKWGFSGRCKSDIDALGEYPSCDNSGWSSRQGVTTVISTEDVIIPLAMLWYKHQITWIIYLSCIRFSFIDRSMCCSSRCLALRHYPSRMVLTCPADSQSICAVTYP